MRADFARTIHNIASRTGSDFHVIGGCNAGVCAGLSCDVNSKNNSREIIEAKHDKCSRNKTKISPKKSLLDQKENNNSPIVGF